MNNFVLIINNLHSKPSTKTHLRGNSSIIRQYHFILPNIPNYVQNFYEFWQTHTFPITSTFYISPPARHVNISIARHLNIYTYDYDFFITYPLSFCPPTLVASQDISLSLPSVSWKIRMYWILKHKVSLFISYPRFFYIYRPTNVKWFVWALYYINWYLFLSKLRICLKDYFVTKVNIMLLSFAAFCREGGALFRSFLVYSWVQCSFSANHVLFSEHL